MSFSTLTKVAVTGATLIAAAIIGCSTAPGQTPQSCTAGETLCGKECIDTIADPANCGACATACKPGEVCGAGVCSLTCGAGSTQCGSSCFDTNVDAKNCGACGNSCNSGEICAAGKCAAQCPMAQTLCLGDGGAVSCANTNTETKNCGGCGNVCDPGKVCGGGKCGDTCGAGEMLCKGPYCAAVSSDNANCGSCGNVCTAGQTCVAGKCSGNCGLKETLCSGQDGGAGYCAKTDTDQANCGACGTVCNNGNGEICVAGKCILQCGAGLTQCGKQCIDLKSDRDNCSQCGKPCGGGLLCVGGACSNLPAECGSATGMNADQWDINKPGCNGNCCENTLTNGTWYRFTGNSKSLVTVDPGPNKCGTAASGWLKGVLPVGGATAALTECYDWSNNVCNWSNPVQVTNCNSYYVYKLQNPPACNLAYCVQ